MPILETTLNSDSSNEGLAADVRALKIAVALLVANSAGAQALCRL